MLLHLKNSRINFHSAKVVLSLTVVHTVAGTQNFPGQGGEEKKTPNPRGHRLKAELTNPTCIRYTEMLTFWPMGIKETTDQILQGYKQGPAGGHVGISPPWSSRSAVGDSPLG